MFNILDLFSTWLSIGVGYFVAVVLIVGGGYLAMFLGANPLNPFAKPLRYIGLLMIAAGLILAAFNYGKATGAADCQAAWKQKNYEAQIARLKQEAEAKKIAAESSAQQAQQLASQKDDLEKQVAEYQVSVRDLAACRRATVDDDRRLCDIVGRSAAGCKPAR